MEQLNAPVEQDRVHAQAINCNYGEWEPDCDSILCAEKVENISNAG